MIFLNIRGLSRGFRATMPKIGDSDGGETIGTNDDIFHSLKEMHALENEPGYISLQRWIPEVMTIAETAVLFSKTYGPQVFRHGGIWSLCL